MPKLKSAKYPLQTAAFLEDPIPGAPYLFFWNDAYDKLTFSPILDVGVNHNTNSTNIAGFGVTKTNETSNNGYGSLMFRLGPNGPVTDVQVLSQATNNTYVNIEPAPFLSMDPSRPLRKHRYDTNGVNKVVSMWGCKISKGEGSDINGSSYWPVTSGMHTRVGVRFNPDRLELSLPYVDTITPGTNNSNGPGRVAANFYPVYFNSATGNLVMCGWGGRSSSPGNYNSYNSMDQYTPAAGPGFRYQNWISSSPTLSDLPASYENETCQFVGTDATGRAIFFLNNLTTDYDHIVVRYQDSDNTSTNLFTNNTAPSAGGTSAGGNRGTGFGNYFSKWSSQVFTDVTSPGNAAWYTPYFDSAGKYHPFFYQWNKSSDSFTRNADITVNWGTTTQADVWEVDTTSPSSVSIRYGMQRLVANETWTVNVGGTDKRYVMLMQMHGNGVAYDSSPKQRTFPVFEVNPVAPKTLTYHSKIEVPSTPKNIIWLNTDKTQLGIIGESNFYMYSFSNTVGWIQTTIIPVKFSSVGVDSLGRIWALGPGDYGYGELHAITQTAPITVSVTSTLTNYNFTGQSINSNVIVNAYDTEGSRIAVSVKLVIDGGSMTFAGSNLTTTIETSSSADTTVPITITGAGISNIISSVVV